MLCKFPYRKCTNEKEPRNVITDMMHRLKAEYQRCNAKRVYCYLGKVAVNAKCLLV